MEGEIKTDNTALRLGITLLVLTIAYNLLEGVVAVWSGIRAGSVSLIGFGIDSMIELSASGIVLWYFLKRQSGADEGQLESRERFAKRFVGWTFIALALYVGFEAAKDLWLKEAPAESQIGIILAVLSIIIMPLLARKKLHVAKIIGSEALEMEAKETICCFWLSVILLLGLTANAVFGWWWADPVGGLLMIPWMWREGTEAIQGENCCGCE